MANSRIYNLTELTDLPDFENWLDSLMIAGDASGLDAAVKIPLTYLQDQITTNKNNIYQNIADIEYNLDLINQKTTLTEVENDRGTMVYSSFITWDNSTITKTEFKNELSSNEFILSISEVGSNELGLYLKNTLTNWQTKLEILLTPNRGNRTLSAVYNSSSYISVVSYDSGGNAKDDTNFWIRIYKWV